MPLEIVTVPCRTDNYAYLVRDADLGTTTLVDAPEAGPIAAELDRRGWGLDAILITHHHDDHIAAVDALRDRYGAEVWGAAADARRLPRLDHAVAPGDRAGPVGAEVLKAHGHTLGHVAYHVPAAEALFSADSLMVMGCGRLFEGTAADMWETLGRLCALPPATRLYSGHEYTEANLRFARSLGSDAALEARAAEIAATRAAGRPTRGPTLALERETNPFLRAADADMKARVGMAGAPDVEVFAEIRRRKDAF